MYIASYVYYSKLTGKSFCFGSWPTAAILFVNDQVNWHLALETADVAVAEVVAELVYLKNRSELVTRSQYTCL